MSWNNIKKKFGYGSLADEETTIETLSTAVKPKSKFDSSISHVVTPLLLEIMVPWIEYCFNKYEEKYFHVKMTAGFDFIQDWKDNHPQRYKMILGAVRPVRNRIVLDEDKLLQVVLTELNKKGWTVTEWEKERFRQNIAVLIKAIYSS